MYIIKIHTKINHCKNHSYKDHLLSRTTEQKNILQSVALIGYPFLVVAKSTAEPGNSNNLYVANSSTPLTRAFFVRSLRTPQERLELQESPERLSMVGRIGQRLGVGCVPRIAVFQPVTLYRQNPGKFSGSS